MPATGDGTLRLKILRNRADGWVGPSLSADACASPPGPSAGRTARPPATRAGMQKDHGRVPMTVSVGLGGIDRDLDLAGREMLAGAKLGVSSPCRRNCS